MQLLNNLVLSKKDHAAIAEAVAERQPGDVVNITLQAKLVENLTDRATFDVTSASVGGSASQDEGVVASPLAASVLGVMSKKPKPPKK